MMILGILEFIEQTSCDWSSLPNLIRDSVPIVGRPTYKNDITGTVYSKTLVNYPNITLERTCALRVKTVGASAKYWSLHHHVQYVLVTTRPRCSIAFTARDPRARSARGRVQ